MNTYFLIVIIFVAIAVVLWLISFIFEALRPVPQTPPLPEFTFATLDPK